MDSGKIIERVKHVRFCKEQGFFHYEFLLLFYVIKGSMKDYIVRKNKAFNKYSFCVSFS